VRALRSNSTLQRRRRRFRLSALVAVLALTPAAAATAAGSSAGQPEVEAAQVEAALARVYPALVNLTVVTERFLDGRAVRSPGAGSGVIVSADGDVLTNYHVAGDSTRITATLTTGEVLEADVVAHDPLTDLSVLRLRLAGRSADAAPIRPARFADRPLQVGDTVLAMGNPLTLSSSVTLGIVSNAHRVFTDFLGNELEDIDLGDGGPTGLFTQWIQHDALILPGNSGGPLVDLDGDVVGINELGGGGMGFAIPASIAREVLRKALAEGRVRRAWLGFSILPVAKTGRMDGALIASVVPGSPADHAGLAAGDILLAVGDRPVAVRFFPEVPDLYRSISELPIGGTVEISYERDGKRLTTKATTEEMEEARGRQAEFRRLGATAQELTGPMALGRQLEPRSGLLVTSLRAGYPAAGAKPPLEVGDLITAVSGRPVRSLDDLAAALDGSAKSEALVDLRRDEERLLSVVHLAPPESARWGGELPKPWLGVRTQVLTPDLAKLVGEPELRGFRVTEIYPWTEAEKAGFRVGDVIVSLDGEAVEAERVQDAENLKREIEARTIGDVVQVGLVRGGEQESLAVRLEARPRTADEARTARQRELEFGVRELTFLDLVDHHLDRDQKGVLVTDVTSGGWAQMGGLNASDLILSIAGRPIDDVTTFEKVMAGIVKERPSVVPIFIRRGWRTSFVFLEPEWSELSLSSGGTR
jgi:S1-C subfamily serine protease